MAEFSKQYCENSIDMKDHPGDFDILEIADGLDNGFYTSIICEGYGFLAIGKNEKGDIMLGMPEKNSDNIEWKHYYEVIK